MSAVRSRAATRRWAGLIRSCRRCLEWLGGLRSARIGLATGAVIGILCSAGAFGVLQRDRADLIDQASDALVAIARPGAGFVSRGLDTLDLTVSIILEQYRRGELGLGEVYLRLRQEAERIDQLEALRRLAIVDPDGFIRYTSDVTRVGSDVSGNEYFRQHRDGVATGMFVDTPTVAPFVSEQEAVPLSWALRDRDGGFHGIVVVGASWRLFAQVFATLINDPAQIVALTDRVGRLYALDASHWPDQQQVPSPPTFLVTDRTAPQPLAGRTVGGYLVRRAKVEGYGLYVVAGVPLETVLHSWWPRVHLGAALILAITAITSVLTTLLHRTMQRLRATAAAAKAAATEARVAQWRAEAGERSKAQFLAAMSHEIRTPMTAVLGMADLLAAERLETRQQGYVRAIRLSGQHLLSVINDILDFSRFDAGGVTLECIDFSMAELLEELRSIMSPQAAERGLSLVFALDEHSPPVVRGDPTRLRQILVNLIGNGLKFTTSGQVSVRVFCRSLENGRADFRFEVEDTGIGIPADRLGELFQPFSQADRSTARRFGGSGLGLAICRQLVEAMGGEIEVESEPGKGSTFSFRLGFEIGDVVLVTEKAGFDPATIRPLTILVAEDVEVNRDLLNATLSRYGHQLFFAENGEQALARAGTERFDIILMDVQMPTMDGIDATRRIRALPPPHGTVPILALTANVMDAERRRCLAAGMNGVLTKPVAWDELFRALAATASSGTAPAVAPSVAPPALDRPIAATEELLDEARITGLQGLAGPARFAQFLENALTSAEQAQLEIERLQGDLPEVAGPAHRLAGTAPSFGLLRVGVLARSIEQQALAGQPVDELVRQLAVTVAATRAEVVRRELLPVPGAA
ncbi:hybrid sensor histidine kinase/response regulator [Geminicoccus harenae]|uniref:hybrid sensor histidine kinase/response regulator n=2 Tax=Geminicoccus harenae TaxID=2498453 RepID=UPI001C95B676|nr:ATP-binding protein [Geminicoccus harenae]